MKYCYYYSTSIGSLKVTETDGYISGVNFSDDGSKAEVQETPLIKKAADELFAYLRGELQDFTVGIKPQGTLFQRAVWSELRKIPYGTTVSYKDVAVAVGQPRAYRAVGRANHANPIAIIIPCHRVIANDGGLGGYGGGLEVKQRLLLLESQHRHS